MLPNGLTIKNKGTTDYEVKLQMVLKKNVI